MSIASFLGWLAVGVILLIAIGIAAVAFKRWSNGRPKAAASLASLHPIGPAIAKAAGIDLTDEELLIRYFDSQQSKGKLAAARRWGNEISRAEEEEQYDKMGVRFQGGGSAEPETDAEAAEEEPSPRPRRTKATS